MFLLPKLLTGKTTFGEVLKPENLHHAIVGALAFAFIGAALTTLTPDTAGIADPVIMITAVCVGTCIGKAFVL